MLRLPLVRMFYPPEVGSESAVKMPAVAKTADDINDMFKELDKDPVVEEKKESKKAKEDEDEIHAGEDDDEDELKLAEPDEEIEKLDLKEPDDIGDIEAPPRKKEILKKYPDVFKDFPFLEKMMYRDREYTQLFGSFDDAKELAEKSEIFNSFESQLLSGNTKDILRSVKEEDSKAFDQIVDDYLPALAEVDKDAYFHVVGNLNRRLIMEMVQEANSLESSDSDRADALKTAAMIVNQYVFGNSKFTAPTNRVNKEEISKKNEIDEERLSYLKERFETARDDLQTRVDNTLRATIDSYIDQKGVMSPYVKKNAIADAMRILTESIVNDEGTVKNLDRLWRAAHESKYSKESLGRIQAYYLSKSKGNLKNALIKARTEALKDATPSRSREKEEEQEEETPRRQRNIIPGRTSMPKSKNGIQKGESVADFFMRD